MLESKLKKWKGKKVKVTYIHKDRDLKKLINYIHNRFTFLACYGYMLIDGI